MRKTDEVLLLLWENGIEDVLDGEDLLVGSKLHHAKHILGIPGSSQLTSLKYWETVFELDEQELRALLARLGFSMSLQARKLPTGAVRKLKAEANKKNTALPVILEDNKSLEQAMSPDRVEWKTIGRAISDIIGIEMEEILGIHYALVADFSNNNDPINPSGPRDVNLLESALYRQQTGIGSNVKYESIEMRGGALLHSLIHNHPFHNGNKRSALVSLLVFLDKNQLMLTCSQDELFRFVLTVAQHRIIKEQYEDLADREVLAIANWISENSRLVKLGDRTLSFRKCKQVLNRYGCEITHSYGGRNFKITRKLSKKGLFSRPEIFISHVSLRNEGEQVEIRTVKKIRQDLRLDDEHGIDSAAFYDDSPTAVDDFIVKYRKTLKRLAKL